MSNESVVETLRHQKQIRILGDLFIKSLTERLQSHDDTKLESPEIEGFDAMANTIDNITYGSEADKAAKELLSVALTHHYARERHHPEHFDNGIEDMNLVDLVEHFLDCMASSLRHNDGNFRKSLETNQKRFGYSVELTKIFGNTINLLD